MAERKIPLSESEAAAVSGGAGGWEKSARGSFVIAGDHLVYTAAAGDTLSGIAGRYGVTVGQLRSWNSLADTGVPLAAGQRLVVYPGTIR